MCLHHPGAEFTLKKGDRGMSIQSRRLKPSVAYSCPIATGGLSNLQECFWYTYNIIHKNKFSIFLIILF